MEAIVANKAENPELSDINLYYAGSVDGNDTRNSNFSADAKAQVQALKDKGVTIAWTISDYYNMQRRYSDIMGYKD